MLDAELNSNIILRLEYVYRGSTHDDFKAYLDKCKASLEDLGKVELAGITLEEMEKKRVEKLAKLGEVEKTLIEMEKKMLEKQAALDEMDKTNKTKQNDESKTTSSISSLYRKFKSYKLSDLVFINMFRGIDNDIIEYHHPYQDDVFTRFPWEKLHCPNKKNVGDRFEVATTCDRKNGKGKYGISEPGRYKVFVRLVYKENEKRFPDLRNLEDYILMVQKDVITEKDHETLFSFLQEQADSLAKGVGKKKEDIVIFNDNKEVPILHFKFKFR